MFKRRQPERQKYGPTHDFRKAAKIGKQLEKEMAEDLDIRSIKGDRFLSVMERNELAGKRLEELKKKGQEGLDILAFMVEAVQYYEVKYIAVEMLGEFAEVEEKLDFRPAIRALRMALEEDAYYLHDREIKRLHLAISDAYKKITGVYPSQCNSIWDQITD